MADDGIDFWANNDGSGMIRFREIGGSWIKSFEGDFGRSIHHQFKIGSPTNILDESLHVFIRPCVKPSSINCFVIPSAEGSPDLPPL